MQLLLRELRSYRKGLLFWCIGMIFLVGASMAKYATYKETGESMTAIVSHFPKTIQIIFGINGFDLSTASGYYGVVFLYIALMATIHAVILGTDVISKEERDRTAEFLFVRPLSRSKVISIKLLTGLINIIVLNIMTLLSSVYFVIYFDKSTTTNNDIILLAMGLLFLQLLFFMIGAMIAAVNHKPKTSASIASSVLLITFILSYIVDFNHTLTKLSVFTPFKYFDAKNILSEQSLSYTSVALSLIIIGTLILAAYIGFAKRDISA